ncbi:MAG TPA: NUDIX hydrolase [Bacteroidota bacterium]|nr:NUDIX hydrolase [Bacteroidota bacterium]
MSLHKWKKLSQTLVVKNPWWEYRKDETQLPNGSPGVYHYVHTNGASMIVPVLDDGRLMAVKQYRYLNERESLEFPCGGVKDGQTFEQTAVQELQEEAGFLSGDLTLVGTFNPYNGVTDEFCNVYLARALTSVPPKPDETEEFERLILLPEQIDDKISQGEIWDGMTIVAWALAKNYL